jgi:hypothetical protein
VSIVNQSLRAGGLEHYGIPRVLGNVDGLDTNQKETAHRCAVEFSEYDFLVRNEMTSFSEYKYFSPFWATTQRFQTMNRTVTGFSTIAQIEGVPDLKALCGEIERPLERVSKLRRKRSAIHFCEWLEKTAGESPDGDMVRAYLDNISERTESEKGAQRI